MEITEEEMAVVYVGLTRMVTRTAMAELRIVGRLGLVAYGAIIKGRVYSPVLRSRGGGDDG
ncbi:uncharacterized protein ColSpa_11157 [Colletotrichum spaethianum]|uniref:Uncharacterized protein n=1 Tax=Colletotrichum spaethianum TaxID=700344 RepID=A0AA37PET4_9PEZI|nr:uncharacterized protein ColSpa_11157 [Colletotrichum spaethianum]GKT50976.1 hypothetical protein ColSpa_11157 [Colletotrichum spaethianum]